MIEHNDSEMHRIVTANALHDAVMDDPCAVLRVLIAHLEYCREMCSEHDDTAQARRYRTARGFAINSLSALNA